MKITHIPALAVWLAAVSTVSAAAADLAGIVQKQGPFSVSLTASRHDGRPEISLSDSLLVTIRAEGTNAIEIKPPAVLTKSLAWKIKKELPAAKSIPWQRTFELYPLAPGDQILHLEPFHYREKTGVWSTVTWKPIPIRVTTQIANADVNDLRKPTDIERLPAVPSIWDWAKWLMGGSAGIALLVLGIRLWRKRRRFAAALSPEQWAQRELDRILALNLPAAGDVERFHTLLANVVRRYLENRFELPARRQTTPEFLQAMEKAPLLSAEQKRLLSDFLERCDLAKFAQVRPSDEECLATAAMAKEFIERYQTSQLARSNP